MILNGQVGGQQKKKNAFFELFFLGGGVHLQKYICWLMNFDYNRALCDPRHPNINHCKMSFRCLTAKFKQWKTQATICSALLCTPSDYKICCRTSSLKLDFSTKSGNWSPARVHTVVEFRWPGDDLDDLDQWWMFRKYDFIPESRFRWWLKTDPDDPYHTLDLDGFF